MDRAKVVGFDQRVAEESARRKAERARRDSWREARRPFRVLRRYMVNQRGEVVGMNWD